MNLFIGRWRDFRRVDFFFRELLYVVSWISNVYIYCHSLKVKGRAFPIILSTCSPWGLGEHSNSTVSSRCGVYVCIHRSPGWRQTTHRLWVDKDGTQVHKWQADSSQASQSQPGELAFSRLWRRLNKVVFPFTMTSSKVKPEAGEARRGGQLCSETATSLWKFH